MRFEVIEASKRDESWLLNLHSQALELGAVTTEILGTSSADKREIQLLIAKAGILYHRLALSSLADPAMFGASPNSN